MAELVVNEYFLFKIADQIYGDRIQHIERVVRAASLLPLPSTEEKLFGLLDLHGTVLPVINMHICLQIAPQKIAIDDRIVVSGAIQPVAFIVNEVIGVVTIEDSDIQKAATIMPHLDDCIMGISKYQDQRIILLNLEQMLGKLNLQQQTENLISTAGKSE